MVGLSGIGTMLDTVTKESLKIEIDTSIGGKEVAAVLTEVGSVRGLPDGIVVDNGPEFISNALDAWAYTPECEAALHLSRQAR